MVFDLLRKPVDEPSEPTHTHPHVQVLTLNLTGAEVGFIGMAANTLFR